jgi:hypothetical protein
MCLDSLFVQIAVNIRGILAIFTVLVANFRVLFELLHLRMRLPPIPMLRCCALQNDQHAFEGVGRKQFRIWDRAGLKLDQQWSDFRPRWSDFDNAGLIFDQC